MVGEVVTGQRFDNPFNYSLVKWGVIIGIAGGLIAFLWIVLEDGFRWSAVAVCSAAIPVGTMVFGGWIEFVLRPREVEVTEHGVVLYRRYGRRPLFVPWAGIVKLNHVIVGPDERNGDSMDSSFFLTEKKWVPVHWRAGEAIREGYRAKLGIYPPNGSKWVYDKGQR